MHEPVNVNLTGIAGGDGEHYTIEQTMRVEALNQALKWAINQNTPTSSDIMNAASDFLGFLTGETE